MLAAQPSPRPPDPVALATDTDVDLLRALTADRDIACAACGYNLRGLAGPACPECNEPLVLPEFLGAHAGFGSGSMAVWVFPLVVDGVLLLLAIDHMAPVLSTMWAGLIAVAVIALLCSFSCAGRRVSARARRRYWTYTRLAVSAHAFAFLMFMLIITS